MKNTLNLSVIKYSLLGATTFLALLITHLTNIKLTELKKNHTKELSEALYLPNAKAISFLSFGYKKALANFIWFKTISYFGRHFASDQHYQWLYLMCDLVTTLDPQAQHVYEFGSNILAWEAHSPKDAAMLLTKAIEHNPRYWKFPYLRGFIYYYFLNEPAKAKLDFINASHMPNAHAVVIRLAAKALGTEDDPAQAIEFLNSILKTSSDDNTKRVLIERLKELHYEKDLRILENAYKKYLAVNTSKPEKIEQLSPYLELPVSMQDPYGGSYQIDNVLGIIKSSSNHKRLGVGK
jgi:tetratricopeptide (TPR) repeat protein